MIKVADGICVEHYVPFTCTPSITILKLQTRCIFLNFDIDDDLPRNPCRNVVHHSFVLPQDRYRIVSYQWPFSDGGSRRRFRL